MTRPALLPDWPYEQLVAHRGGGYLAPENTLSAFREGMARGYRFFEFDVRLTADGHPIVLHDEALWRTTGEVGTVGRSSLSDILALDAGRWFGAAFAGEPVPTLEAVAGLLRQASAQANVEMKSDGRRRTRTGRVVADAVARLWEDATPSPILSSFAPQVLEAAASAQPQLPRALLLSHWGEEGLRRARDLGCHAIHVAHGEMTADRVREAHELGLRLACFTVNDPGRVADLLAWGVDSVITDALDRIPPEGVGARYPKRPWMNQPCRSGSAGSRSR